MSSNGHKNVHPISTWATMASKKCTDQSGRARDPLLTLYVLCVCEPGSLPPAAAGMSAQPSKKREWCGNDTTTRCSVCKKLLICSKACMKAIWPEHKRTYRKKAATTVDVLTEDLSKVKLDNERSLWLVIPEP